MSPALPYPQDFDDEPRQPEPDHQDQQGERVEGLVGSELPGSEVGERCCDHDSSDEPADQDRCPLRQLVASAHGLRARQTSALPGRGQSGWHKVQGRTRRGSVRCSGLSVALRQANHQYPGASARPVSDPRLAPRAGAGCHPAWLVAPVSVERSYTHPRLRAPGSSPSSPASPSPSLWEEYGAGL
jgi:hypothetical protein